ncbi:MAG: 1-deoxy-D-xylulose-5-phosphate synthase [Candidatus Tectomicrobia bacterium]|nr:1-deoxy-D-xylulose-5-phosphate synthase [Candidatus Tectomicrobia bacterium]
MRDAHLSSIQSPKDLKQLPRQALPNLALEIREYLLEVLSQTGGHLASNLGAVELSLALHYVFDSPTDRIVWDVGHQGYVHKMLTGRAERLPTIRQYGGLSGFLRREESPHDAFNAGHGGTSISAALGMTMARDFAGDSHKVVAVIGDGSLTAGMAFEALNHAGVTKRDFIVVLNDNSMGISPNVGALSAYLNRIISGQFYNRMRRDVEALLENIPTIGTPMHKVALRFKEAVKGFLVPGRIFEDLGFRYFGPIDGHHLDSLIDTFDNIKHLSGCNLVHVITTKGKGYHPAEQKQVTYHGVSPFDVKTGAFHQKKSAAPSYTSVFVDALIHLAERDERVVGITAAMAEGTGLAKFAERFPGRFFDVGMAEQHAVTFAAGLAAEGYKPVAAIYSTFLQRAYDQVIHDVCIMNLPVTFALDRAGLAGEDGPTHHGAFDLTYLRALPNMVVMAPKDENELRHLLKTALDHPGPAAVRFPRGAGVGVALDEEVRCIPIGEAEPLVDGSEVALLAVGGIVSPALEAARLLAGHGISAAVVNMRFIKPLDEKLLGRLAERRLPLVTIEDNTRLGGFGSAVLEFLADHGYAGIPVLRLGLPDAFIEHGAQNLLRSLCGLDSQGIAASTRAWLRRS